MNKTKPTLAQQTYEKVCAIETILNSLLADSRHACIWPARAGAPPLSGNGWPRNAPFGHPLGGRARLSALFR